MTRFIVNSGGGVHSVNEEDYPRLLAQQGYRAATPEEIARWHERQNLPVPPDLLKPSQSPGESAEPVLLADGGGATSSAAEPGPSQPEADPSPSSTGDESEGHSPTQQPGLTKAGGAPRGARTRRRGSGV